MDENEQEQYKALFEEALEVKDKIGLPNVDTAFLLLIYDKLLERD